MDFFIFLSKKCEILKTDLNSCRREMSPVTCNSLVLIDPDIFLVSIRCIGAFNIGNSNQSSSLRIPGFLPFLHKIDLYKLALLWCDLISTLHTNNLVISKTCANAKHAKCHRVKLCRAFLDFVCEVCVSNIHTIWIV